MYIISENNNQTKNIFYFTKQFRIKKVFLLKFNKVMLFSQLPKKKISKNLTPYVVGIGFVVVLLVAYKVIKNDKTK